MQGMRDNWMLHVNGEAVTRGYSRHGAAQMPVINPFTMIKRPGMQQDYCSAAKLTMQHTFRPCRGVLNELIHS